MVTKLRPRAKAHIYLREWRKHLKVRAVDMAERLEIERESYYRLEREPKALSVGEVFELADRLGIEPAQLYFPPDWPESLDTIAKDLPDAQRALAVDIVKRLAAKSA